LKCYPRIAHSESECIKVLPKGSPPTSGAVKMIHKNQSIKELPSRQPVRKGRAKAIRSRHRNRQFFYKTIVTSDTYRRNEKPILKPKKESTLSKNCLKAVKFDRCTQLLVLQCVSHLGVALQASSSITRDRNRKANDFISAHRTN
jgi:hypothetical protein